MRRADIRSVLAGGAGRLLTLPISIITAVLTTKLVIADAGAQTYAVLAVITSLATLLPLNSLGLAAPVMTVAAHRGPHVPSGPVLHEVLTSAVRKLVAAAVVVLLLDAGITALRLWPAILGVAEGNEVNGAAGLALALLAINMPLSLFQSVLVGVGKAGAAALWQIPGSLLALAITVFTLSTSQSVEVLAGALPAGILLMSTLQSLHACRSVGTTVSDVFRGALVRRSGAVYLGAMAWPMLVITLVLPLALQSDRLVLSHARPLADVASYSLGLQMYVPLWTITSTAGLALWPIFARVRTKSTAGSITTLHWSMASFATLGFIFAGSLVVFGPPLGEFLSGGKVALPGSLLLAFGALLLVQSLQLPMGMFLTRAHDLRFQAVFAVVMVAVNVPISYLLARHLGAVGPIVASVVCVACLQALPNYVRVLGVRRVDHAHTATTRPGAVGHR